MPDKPATRDALIEALNQDLSREYQAIIAYVVYSQVLKGAQYMAIAKELEKHATEELQHALTISKHIDYLGGMRREPCVHRQHGGVLEHDVAAALATHREPSKSVKANGRP